jgi:hypothetical protein
VSIVTFDIARDGHPAKCPESSSRAACRRWTVGRCARFNASILRAAAAGLFGQQSVGRILVRLQEVGVGRQSLVHFGKPVESLSFGGFAGDRRPGRTANDGLGSTTLSNGASTNSAAMLSSAVISWPCCLASAATVSAQDWIRTGTGLGVERVRLAACRLQALVLRRTQQTSNLLKTFNDTLWNDLDNAGIFDSGLEEFSSAAGVPGQPSEVNSAAWNSPPPNTSMLAFGNSGRCRRQSHGTGLALRSSRMRSLAAGPRQAVQRLMRPPTRCA